MIEFVERSVQALLDRGFGRPKVEIQNTNTDFRDALEQVRKRLIRQQEKTERRIASAR